MGTFRNDPRTAGVDMNRSVRIALAAAFLLIPLLSFAQPWMKGFENRDRKTSFYERQAAFEKYWDGKVPTKGQGYKQFKRWEWFMSTRVDDQGFHNPMDLWNGWLDAQLRFGDRELDEAAWTHTGPVNTQPFYVGGLGRINCVAFHPTDPDIMYIGAASGGCWRTTDHGENWTVLTDDLPLLGVGGIAVDHEDPSIVYLGTGDGDASDTYSIGVLKSLDGGDTWNTTGLEYEVGDGMVISKVLLHPEDSSTILVATGEGIYKSTDAAETWDRTLTGNGFKDLDVDPNNPDVWYASRSGLGVFKSVDAGETWERLFGGFPANGISRIAIDVSPVNSNTVYALIANNASGFYGFYRSQDAGENWDLMTDTPNILGWSYDGDDNGGQGWYDLTIQADPNDEDVAYCGGINLWKTYNGGEDFECIAHWWGDRCAFVHADQHALEFNGDSLYATHDGGINYSTDFGTTWTDITDGIAITQIYRMGVWTGGDEVERVTIGNQDNGSKWMIDGEWYSTTGGDGFETHIDPVNPNIAFSSVYYGSMYRTMNGGNNWDPCNNGTNDNEGYWVTPIERDPYYSETIYKSTIRMYRTEDHASSWSDLSGSFNGSTMRVIDIARSDPWSIITGDRSGNLFRTYDYGYTWEAFGDVVPTSALTYIEFHPESPDTVYATVGGYNDGLKVYKSHNGGISWNNISGNLPNLPANCVAVNPRNPDHVYVGMDVGVYFSPDGGATWESWNNGLPNVIVNELEFHQTSNTLVAATYGRGVWQSPAEPVNEEPEIRLYTPNNGIEMGRGETRTIGWYDTIDEEVYIELWRDGEMVQEITDATESDGVYEWEIPANAAIADNYLIRIGSVDDPDIYDESVGGFSIAMEPPVLSFPEHESEVYEQPVLFLWNVVEGIDDYHIQVCYFSSFEDRFLVMDTTVTATSAILGDLLNYRTYYWRVAAVTPDGAQGNWSDVWNFYLSLGAPELDKDGIPEVFEITSAYPNPFNPSTAVTVGVPEMNHVELSVFNINGALVKTLSQGELKPGYHTFSFDATGMASGVYLVRAKTAKETAVQKIVLVK